MRVYFLGIGGTGIGPLALIAHQADYDVLGSDKQKSVYTDYLHKQGITDIAIGSSDEHIAQSHAEKPIDWLVYSSAVPKENADHPILKFARENGIKQSKRDDFLNMLLQDKDLKMIAIAGTHGKTTTTAMAIWLFKQLGLPVSYSVGGKLSFGEMGEYDPNSEYFVYEADEYDRNFLSFKPYISIISGIDWDHPDIYPTREEHNQAFRDFVNQSKMTIAWQTDIDRADIDNPNVIALAEIPLGLKSLTLPGEVNRRNARLVMQALAEITDEDLDELADIANAFPGVGRRFEQITPGLYSDYAHTPEKIRGALQLAHEVAAGDVVVIYEGLHNTRQHFIKEDLKQLFEEAARLYIVPSYLAREDESLEMLTPEILSTITESPAKRIPSQLDDKLKKSINAELAKGNLVLCLSAGGGGSLDEWLRRQKWN